MGVVNETSNIICFISQQNQLTQFVKYVPKLFILKKMK